MFEQLRDALRAALAAATQPGDVGALVRQMREAVVEAKVAVQELGEALRRAELEIGVERQRLADAERRGRLAAEIQDQETVEVAARFAAKHRERVAMLERKLQAQRDELALAQSELTEMHDQLRAAERDRPAAEAGRSTERAWRDVQAAGGERPDADPQYDLLKAQIDRATREAAAERKLQDLKKRVGKD